jgi:hypothetical protein
MYVLLFHILIHKIWIEIKSLNQNYDIYSVESLSGIFRVVTDLLKMQFITQINYRY